MADSPLISTKFFVPPAHAELIARPRLYALLDGGMRQPLTLVSASPGFGKTMLVAEWLRQRSKQPTAWLSLDEGEREAMQEMLWLNNFSGSTYSEKQIEGIAALASKVSEVIGGFLPNGRTL